MNLFARDPERHIAGRTPRITGGGKPSPSLKNVTPGFRKRATQIFKNGNYARMGLRKLFGS